MRREAAAVKIQKHVRRHESRKGYIKLHASVLTLQTALRAIAARKEFRFKKQTKASTIIQVIVDSLVELGPSTKDISIQYLNSLKISGSLAVPQGFLIL
jgi:hypothetical protein